MLLLLSCLLFASLSPAGGKEASKDRLKVRKSSKDDRPHSNRIPALEKSKPNPGARLQPNIILMVADDLGYNDVSWHNPDIVSPHLEQLAREGVRLEQAYVQPLCTPTRH
jgi:arylsulfatase A-like enzyme